MFNQFLNRAAGNTKIVQGKTFIPTNNYDLSYLKQPKSNPSLINETSENVLLE